MELEKDWRKIPRTGESRRENRQTQPIKDYKVFNNPAVVTESWYPILPSHKIKSKQAHSFKIGAQRVVLFRGEDNQLRALDAFCPHMGADLSRGKIEGNSIRCYFHRWKFDGQGHLQEIPCKSKLPFQLKTKSYPVEEKYGYIWVFSAEVAPYPVPAPIGLENEDIEGRYLMRPRLFVHHHVLMASAIDLQHFASVHDLHADFDLKIEEKMKGLFHWSVEGHFSKNRSWRMRLARKLLGPSFQYDALFAGGSVICMTYGRGHPWGAGHVIWGAIPGADGISDVCIFIVQKKQKGFLAPLKSHIRYLLTVALLGILKDDDITAFPRMRFQAQNLIDQDASVAHLIRLTETLPRSTWSFES